MCAETEEVDQDADIEQGAASGEVLIIPISSLVRRHSREIDELYGKYRGQGIQLELLEQRVGSMASDIRATREVSQRNTELVQKCLDQITSNHIAEQKRLLEQTAVYAHLDQRIGRTLVLGSALFASLAIFTGIFLGRLPGWLEGLVT